MSPANPAKTPSQQATPRTTWRLLKPHAKPIMPLLVLTAFLSGAGAALQAAILLLIRPVFNLVLFPKGINPDQAAELSDEAAAIGVGQYGMLEDYFLKAADWLGRTIDAGWAQDTRTASLALVMVALLVLTVGAAVSAYGFNQLTNLVSLRMVVDLRVRVAEHLMNLSLHYHGKRKLGDLLSRISSDMQATLTAVVIWFKDFLQNTFTAITFLAAAAYCAPWLTLIMVCSIPLLAVPVSFLAKKVRKRSTQSLTSLGASVQVLSQMFLGIRTVKAFRAEKRELERYRELNEGYLNDFMRLVRTVSLTQAWTITYTHLGLGVLLMLVGLGSIHWGLFTDVGAMSGFFLANSQAYSAIKRLTRAFTKVEEAVGASQRLEELLAESPDVTEPENGIAIEAFHQSIRFEGVEFAYPEGEGSAIEQLDLEVRAGETLAFVGASGSGKSTLMSLVSRFYDPTGGRVVVDGHDLREVTLDSWCKQYSLVDQSPFLFHTSIEENLRYGKPDATREEIVAACKAAQIHDFIETLAEGYATNVEAAGARRSGGPRGGHPRVRVVAPERLRDRRGGRRRAPLRRPAPAHHDRPRPAQGCAAPAARRGHQRPRHRVRARRAGGPRDPDEGPHRDRDRPPPLDHPERQPHRRLRQRPHGRARHPRRAQRQGRRLLARARDAGVGVAHSCRWASA
ncbi:MAG: ABC transporter ATP-binding protein [Planctomycetota bacterium]|nr:ABC transporter ATP-binding protein [Planctomycetota bacterium]